MKPFGRGPMQSLRARVDEDVLDLIKGNKALRRARYTWATRVFRTWISGRSILDWLANYAVCVGAALAFEWLGDRFVPPWGAAFDSAGDADFVRDVAGFFITAQVGLLAVLTVAVSVVTLLSAKDEGRSVNTDVRLYYEESYTGEVVTSGVAFLIVVVLQLFWPFQQFIHQIPGLTNEALFQHILSAVHGGWLILNLALFFNFLKITLDFVAAENRARLRKRYVATEIIPRDVARRLLAAYYQNTPSFILGPAELKSGPLVSFGMGLLSSDRGATELSLTLKGPRRLHDVWLLPLGIALKAWHRRSRSLQGQPEERFGEPSWDGQLAVPLDVRTERDGPVDLVLRLGGAPLSPWERRLLRWSFRFARTDRGEQSLPAPAEFIDQLVSNVVSPIDAGVSSAFDDALRELIDFHGFVLEAQNTRDEGGGNINLAQVNDGWFVRPDQQWIRAYRRAYVAAANRLATEAYFTNGMARAPIALWPQDPETYPAGILQTILDLGIYQVIALEDWVTKHTLVEVADGDRAPALAGSDLRAYEEALIGFVAGWESLQAAISGAFHLPNAMRDGEAAFWRAGGASWPSLQTHLGHAAYFFASAVWNDDRPGSERYSDLVLRWPQPFYRELQNAFPFRDALLLTPNLLGASLDDATAAAKRTLLYPRAKLDAPSIFGAILREAHNDIVCIAGALALYWHATKRQPSPTAAQVGVQILRRERLAGAGADLLEYGGQAPKSIFRLVFDVLIRRALGSRFDDGSYTAYLDGLIRLLNTLSEPRMVPGRIYSGVGLDGFDTLNPELLAILAANLPQDDGGVANLFARLLAGDPAFQADLTLRDFGYTFGVYASSLGGEGDERFRATFAVFLDAAEMAERRTRLKAIFDTVVDTIEAARRQRIRDAPLDPEKHQKVVEAATETLLVT